ncbi:MAG TPA: hypothetical protein V6D11_27440 [Waterburya sp.]|jgi:hypothetical protein
MKAKTEMIALQEASTTQTSLYNEPAYSGILSEKSAIILCSLGVAVFAIPVLVIIHMLSGLYRGVSTVYQLLSGLQFESMDDI